MRLWKIITLLILLSNLALINGEEKERPFKDFKQSPEKCLTDYIGFQKYLDHSSDAKVKIGPPKFDKKNRF